MANIPLRQIRAVIAVCEEGSFTRAAQRENATQSGISQHVAAVERALKVKLFERATGGVTPTPAGLRYYKRCVEAVGALEHAAEEARSMAGEVTGDVFRYEWTERTIGMVGPTASRSGRGYFRYTIPKEGEAHEIAGERGPGQDELRDGRRSHPLLTRQTRLVRVEQPGAADKMRGDRSQVHR